MEVEEILPDIDQANSELESIDDANDKLGVKKKVQSAAPAYPQNLPTGTEPTSPSESPSELKYSWETLPVDPSTGRPPLSGSDLGTIEALKSATKNAFQQEIFKDQKNRDVYFNTLAKTGKYSDRVLDIVKREAEAEQSSAFKTATAPAEAIMGAPEHLANAAHALSPERMVTESIANDENILATAGKGVIKGMAETGTGLIGAANVLPPVAMFTSGITALEEAGIPAGKILMPVSTGIEKYYHSKRLPVPDWIKDTGTVTDLVLGGFVFHKASELYKDIKEGVVKPQDITDALNEAFESPEALQDYIESKGDKTVEKSLKEKRELESQMSNPSVDDPIKREFIQPKLEEVTVKLQENINKNTAESTEAASLLAHRDYLKDQAQHLEGKPLKDVEAEIKTAEEKIKKIDATLLKEPEPQTQEPIVAETTESANMTTGTAPVQAAEIIKPEENAVQEQSSLSLKEKENEQSDSDKNNIPQRPQSLDARKNKEAKGNYSPEDTKRRMEVSRNWLEAIERDDSEAIRNIKEKLLGEQIIEERQIGEVLDDNDGGRQEVRTPSNNGEKDGSETAKVGTRASHQSQRAGQSGGEPNATNPLGTFETPRIGEVSENEGSAIELSKIERGAMVDALRSMRDMSSKEQRVRGARTMLKMLDEAIQQKKEDQKKEIINLIIKNIKEHVPLREPSPSKAKADEVTDTSPVEPEPLSKKPKATSAASIKVGDDVSFTHAGSPKKGKIIQIDGEKAMAQDAMGFKYPLKAKDFKKSEQGFIGKPAANATTGGGAKISKASAITEKASKLFNVPIRTGHVTWGKRIGVFKTRDEVVRLKAHNDLATMSHEVAHHIDKKILQNNYGGFENEIKHLDYDQKKLRPHEGFAEFVRMYLTGQKAEAKATAPGFYDYFENTVLKNDADLSKKINELESDIADWRTQGSEERVLSTIDFDGKAGGVSWRDRLRKGRELWEDQLAPLRYAIKDMMGDEPIRPSEDPFRVAQVTNKTAGAKARAFVLDGVTDFYGNKVFKPLKEILAPFTDSRADYESAVAYVVSKRKLDRATRGHEFPEQDLKDAQYVVDKYSADPKYDAFARDVNKWNNYTIDYMADAGRLSPEAKQRIVDSDLFYVPFKKVLDGNGAVGATNKRFTDLGNPVKKFGKQDIGTPDIIDPIEAMIQNTERMINMADKTRVVNMFLDLAEKNEGMGRWVEKVKSPMTLASTTLEGIKADLKKAGVDLSGADMDAVLNIFGNANQYLGKDNIAAVWRNGKLEFYEFEKSLFEALKGSNSIDIGWFADTWLGKGMKLATQSVRLGATGIRGGFALITNPIRDIVTAGMQSAVLPKGADKKIINTTIATPIRSLKGIGEAVKNSEYLQKWKSLGGEQAQPLALDRRFTQDLVQEALINGKKKNLIYTAKHPIEAIRKIFSFTEEGVRVGEFKKVYDSYEKLIDEAVNKGDVAEVEKLRKDQAIHASEAANNVTVNFKKAGRYAQILNQFVFGFNPALQGISSMAKAFRDTPLSTSAKALAWLTAPSLALWAMNKDEQWYKDLPDWEKFGYWHFKIGEHIVRLPKPFEWGYLFASLPESVAQGLYDQNPDAVKDLFKYGKNLLPPVLPDLVKTPMELYFNWDFFRDKPLISKGMQEMREEDQYLPSTSQLAKELGEAMGVAPIKIDHLLSGYTGGLVTDIMKTMPNKDYNEWADWPIIGRLFVREMSINFAGKGVDEFYRMYENANKIQRSVNKRARTDNGLSPTSSITSAQKSAAMDALKLNAEERVLYENSSEIRDAAEKLSELNNKRSQVLRIKQAAEVKKLALREIGETAKKIAIDAMGFKKHKPKPTPVPRER